MRLHSIEPLNEGGNIFKNASGESITGRISRADIAPTIKWLETITKLPLVDNTLGSVGKKESSGDLDIAVDQNAVSKDELVARLTQWVKAQKEDPKNWIKKSGISVHFLTPIRGNKTLGYVQSDFMFGDDIEHMKFGLYSAGDSSKFSGADRNLLMSSVAKSLPGDYKYSWQKGLIERSTGNTITRDPDQIAKILLGSMKYTRKDLDSVESIISAIKNPPDKIAGPNRYELLTALADRLISTEGKKPAEIRADSEEADRLHRILDAKIEESSDDYEKNRLNEEYKTNYTTLIPSISKELRYGMISQAIHTINSYELTIDNCPGLKELLNKYKHDIVSYLLNNLKDNINTISIVRTQFINNTLLNTKINWPELVTINKSLEHEKSRLNESEFDYVLDIVDRDLLRDRIGYAIHSIKSLGMTVENTPLLEKLLNHFKKPIIQYFLKKIKEHAGNNNSNINLSNIENDINILKSTGIEWIELGTIHRSLEHEKSRLSEGIFETDNSNLDTADEQTQIAAIKQNGYAIQHIKNPSEQVQLAAVKQHGFSIQFIKNPSEAVQLAAVKKVVQAIQFIKNPSEVVQLAAVKKDGYAIQFIKNPSEQVQLAAVKQNGLSIQFIDYSEQVLIAAINQNGNVILYFSKPPIISILNKCKPAIIKEILTNIKYGNLSEVDDLLQIVAKTNWPELDTINKSLNFEKNKRINRLREGLFDKVRDWYMGPLTGFDDINMSSPEKIKLAIEKNGFNIKFIKNPSEELQMLAVSQSPLSIVHIQQPSIPVQIKAVEGDSKVIAKIKNPCEQAQLIAVTDKPSIIDYINNPTEKVQKIAVNNNPCLITSIKNPTPDVLIIAIKKYPLLISYIQDIPAEIINQCKKEVVTFLLQMIKNQDVVPATSYCYDLVNLGLNWAELPTIKRSLDHDIEKTKITHIPQDHNDINDDLNLGEAYLLEAINDPLESVKHYLAQNDIIGAIMEIKTYKLTVINTPGLRIVLEKYKSDIIRFLLERFKNHINSIHHIIKLEFTIIDLIWSGIGWLELSTILNGVQSQRIIDMKHR